MTIMPAAYKPPLGLPFFWKDEISGTLISAVNAYLDNRIKGTAITDEQLGLVRDYLCHWINAPCWENPEFQTELADLRISARDLATAKEISEWIFKALDIGLDPL